MRVCVYAYKTVAEGERESPLLLLCARNYTPDIYKTLCMCVCVCT